jgi:hypothetical protein
VVADKLAKSLDDDLQKLEKLMKENNIGKLNGLFTGRAGTGQDEDEVKRFTDEMARTDSEGLRSVRDAKGKDAIDAAMKAWQAKSLAAIDSEIRYFRELVKESERLQGGQVIHTRDAQGNPVDVRTAQRGPDQTGAIIERRGVVDTLNELRDNAQLQMDNYALSVRKGNDEATNANAKLDRPLDDKLAEVGEQLKESQDRLDASGKSEEMKEMASADIAAGKAIMEVNKALERLHEKPMPQATEDAFHLLEAMIAQNNAQAKWNDSLAATTSKMEERTASYRDLAAAVGLSYEATKKAEAELAVKEFAKEKYGDAAWMADPQHQADISKVRADASDEFDAKHAEGVQSSLKKLDDQISLEQQLARVQADGEEAVRQTTLAAKIQAIERDNDAESAKKLVQAEKDLYAAERLNAAAKNIAEINVEIDATKRLAAAQIEGAESARRAELELKYEKMGRAGATKPEIDATRLEDELKHQDAITDAVLKTANADRDRLKAIDQEAKAAILLEGTGADELGIMIKLRDLENERLKILAQELIARGSAEDGMRAFFVEMQESAKTTASIVYDALNSAFGKLSENLTQLITGGKTKFGQMFKDIGREMLDATIKQQLQHGLGALGKKLGIGKKDVELTRKGQTPDTAIYVTDTGGSTAPASTTPGASTASPNLKQLGGLFGGAGGFLGGLLQSLFHGGSGVSTSVDETISFGGALAGGGDMSADKAYIAGEDGPEIIRGINATVMSNAASRKLVGGGDHYYTIDARGTDPALTEQRVRDAIISSHNSAIGTAVAATADNVRRNPKR